jgi:hypothetical protein
MHFVASDTLGAGGAGGVIWFLPKSPSAANQRHVRIIIKSRKKSRKAVTDVAAEQRIQPNIDSDRSVVSTHGSCRRKAAGWCTTSQHCRCRRLGKCMIRIL